MVCSSLKVNAEQKWYFDSGSSKHMTSNKELLTNLQPCVLESVTFGDKVRDTVIRCGLLKVLGMPELENVLLVDGLKVNLISIRQLCDHNLFVKFTKNKCSVLDNTNSCVMEGRISPNNCYMLTFVGLSLATNLDIWNRRHSHFSLKNLSEALAAHGEAYSKASQDDATCFYHKSSKTPTHGSNGANAAGKPRRKEVCIRMCR